MTDTPKDSLTLMTPGPVGIPDSVLSAINSPVIHHRSESFQLLMGNVQNGLQYLFQTKGKVLTLCGTGSFGMEATFMNLLNEDSRVMIVDFGKFSHRWAQCLEKTSKNSSVLAVEWGKRPTVDNIYDHANEIQDLEAIVLTHCETSTGVDLDLEEICFALRKIHPKLLIIVDAVSTIGVSPFYMDEWGIDVAVCSGQKGLMNPTGLTFVAMNTRAISSLRSDIPYETLDFHGYLTFLNQNLFPFTAPVSLLYGVEKALTNIQNLTLPAIWNRTHSLKQQWIKGLSDLDAVFFGEGDALPLTVFNFPDKNASMIIKSLAEYGHFLLSEGQGVLKGSQIRVAHFGNFDSTQSLDCIKALKDVLKKV